MPSIRSPSRSECLAKFSAVRAGSWQIRQFVPSRNVVAEDHRAHLEAEAVVLQRKVLDDRRVAREADAHVRAVERLGPRLVRAAEGAQLGVRLDDQDVETGLLQVGGGGEAARQPAADDDDVVRCGHPSSAPACAASASMTTRPAMAAVTELESRLGAVSTTSTPTSPWRETPRTSSSISREVRPPGVGHACARRVGAVERVDVDAQVDAVRAAAGHLERLLDRRLHATLPDVLEPDHGDPLLAAVANLGPRVHPTADREQCDVLRVEPGVDGARDRAAVIELLAAHVERGVEVRVDQDETGVRDLLLDGSNRRDRDRVVTAEGGRDRAGGEDLADVPLGIREGLLGVRQDDVAVAAVDRVERLHEVEVPGGVVAEELARDLANAARPVVRPGAADRGGVPGHAVDRGTGPMGLQGIGVGGDVRQLQEGAGQPGVEQ